MTLEEFIFLHRNDDVALLALSSSKYPDIDISRAITQISGWQKAKDKLPSWASIDDILYPVSISLEQCSSEKTAKYKAFLASKLIKKTPSKHLNSLVDLTGGFAVDFSFLSKCFSSSIYVEKETKLCNIAKHNLKVLGISNVLVVNDEAKNFLSKMDYSTLIFIDPSRRDNSGKKVCFLEDCSPNIMDIKNLLIKKADYVMIKLSPMLDWHKAVKDLGKSVGQVHIISIDNECKELLLVLSSQYKTLENIFCVFEDNIFSYSPLDVSSKTLESKTHEEIYFSQGDYLYEPNSSVMKAGCFELLENRFNVRQISKNSHLFVSKELLKDFPGRRFIIKDTCSMNQKSIKEKLLGLKSANLTVRNFPLSVKELRKRLSLKDGGSTYIFATTLEDSSHVLFICEKTLF